MDNKRRHMEKMIMNNKCYGYKIENYNVIVSDGESFEELESRGYETKGKELTSLQQAYDIASYERKKKIRDQLI